MYSVKELFATLQGEGAHAGRAAVFCRFAGCNLWSGREEDRANAVFQFCDTDFVGTDGDGGGRGFLTPDQQAEDADVLEPLVAAQPVEHARRRVVAVAAAVAVSTGAQPVVALAAPASAPDRRARRSRGVDLMGRLRGCWRRASACGAERMKVSS